MVFFLTFAKMLAADTIGYNESAFFATVTLIEGNREDKYFCRASGMPTVSTYS